MSKLFLDVLGNKELVYGYQIEDSIVQKYNLKPDTICPFTGLRVEALSPQQVQAAEKAERQKNIKQQKKALGKKVPEKSAKAKAPVKDPAKPAAKPAKAKTKAKAKK